MPIPRKYHMQAGQYREDDQKRRIINRAKVVAWLRKNPLSTGDEIFKGTGFYVGSVVSNGKIIKRVKYEGRYVYRVSALATKF